MLKGPAHLRETAEGDLSLDGNKRRAPYIGGSSWRQDFKEFLQAKFNSEQMGLFLSSSLPLKRHSKHLNLRLHVLGTYHQSKPQHGKHFIKHLSERN